MSTTESFPGPSLEAYQEFVRKTDQNRKKGLHGFRFPLLGLFGEVGSLLSELKKKQRDRESYYSYDDALVEEFGDSLWYFTNIVDRAKLTLSELAVNSTQELSLAPRTSSNKLRTFGDLQNRIPASGGSGSEGLIEAEVLTLAARVGSLLGDVDSLLSNRELLKGHLVEIFRSLIHVANDAHLSLEHAVKVNTNKITDRWPINPIYPRLFDAEKDPDEQIPRRIKMLIEEKTVGGRTFVIQSCNGIKMGDRLTDNRSIQDDYRFHDVFHLSYAALLGWSPVIRGQFKVKRKSDPAVDENEDGARAALIEEGVSTWIFNHASELDYYAAIKTLDFSLLKAVKALVQGYEVEECPLWLWEKAILDGYKVFRYLKENRRGLVVADLTRRTLVVRDA